MLGVVEDFILAEYPIARRLASDIDLSPDPLPQELFLQPLEHCLLAGLWSFPPAVTIRIATVSWKPRNQSNKRSDLWSIIRSNATPESVLN
jgi:hypothetical protein